MKGHDGVNAEDVCGKRDTAADAREIELEACNGPFQPFLGAPGLHSDRATTMMATPLQDLQDMRRVPTLPLRWQGDLIGPRSLRGSL